MRTVTGYNYWTTRICLGPKDIIAAEAALGTALCGNWVGPEEAVFDVTIDELAALWKASVTQPEYSRTCDALKLTYSGGNFEELARAAMVAELGVPAFHRGEFRAFPHGGFSRATIFCYYTTDPVAICMIAAHAEARMNMRDAPQRGDLKREMKFTATPLPPDPE